MKVCSVILLVAAVVLVECGHTFMGTNFLRPEIYHRDVIYSSKMFQKRIEYLNYTLPAHPGFPRFIQGILAFDLTHSGASANITRGGVGYNFVNLRMKSDRAKKLHYDVYIYA